MKFVRPFPVWAGILLVAVIGHVSMAAEAVDGKAPLPPARAREAALGTARGIYAADMGKAGTTEQTITLARTSIQRAKTLNEDLPGSFALLQLARELAIESGDTALALEVIAAVEERFHVEGPVLKAGALAGLCRWNNPPLKNLPKDNAVIVAVRSFDAKGGVYRLETLADDGIRVWIDGRPVLENWSNHMIRQNTAQFPLRAGEHTMRVEYYEAGALSRLGVWLRRVQ